MISTFVMIAAFATGADEPTPLTLEAHKVPGPVFRIPCRTWELPREVVSVELWYSSDRGKTWTKAGEIPRDQKYFEFDSKKAGEYFFTVRLLLKDGSAVPKERDELTPQIRVIVSEDGEQPKLRLSDEAADLDVELVRLELDLIRKEIKRLAGENLTPETEQRIDRLRSRLSDIQNRIVGIDRLQTRPSAAPFTAPLIGDSADRPTTKPNPILLPEVPTMPMLPPALSPRAVAPPPHAPERSW